MTQVAVKERGIIFTAWSIPKILDRTKTQTRRTWGLERINLDPDNWQLIRPIEDNPAIWHFLHSSGCVCGIKCPYGQVGDRLYVKEIWALRNDGRQVMHKAAYEDIVKELDLHEFAKQHGLPPLDIKWRSLRFMFKKYARIWLEITDLRAERLQDITEEDARAEGFKYHIDKFQPGCSYIVTAKEKFEDKWDSPHAKRGYGWEANPWVWVIGFSVCNK